MNRPQNQSSPGTAQLSVWDGVSIIIGIVVGVSIFKVPALVFGAANGPWAGLGVWLLGGLLTFVGALCYAELATTYPRSGGDYIYLTRAYGPSVGFLFGWAQLVAILTGSCGAMAYVFADYGVALWDIDASQGVWLAVAAIIGLSLMNLFGIALSKATQNVLTVAKVVGFGGVLLAGFFWGKGYTSAFVVEPTGNIASFGFAMILVLYAYGGWNDAAFVAAEVRDRKRNMARVLLLGTGGITLLYVLINAAYLWGLGFTGLCDSMTPAADVLEPMLGAWGSKGMSLLVMVSALGALNGLILTGSRVHAALGKDHGLFALLGRWHPRLGAPIWSILAQAGVSLMLIVAVGTETGQGMLDGLLAAIGLDPLPWDDKYGGGFDLLVAGTAPVFWLFFLLTGSSLFVLRFRDPEVERPFSVPFYPVTPIVFCLMCGYMLYSSIKWAEWLSLLGFVPLLLGLPLYLVSRWIGPGRGAEPVIETSDGSS